MMNAMDRAIAAHAATLNRFAGTDVVIVRGGRRTESLKAVMSSSTHEVYDGDDIPTKVKFSDWLFTKSDLVLNDEPLNVKPGDVIIATIRTAERRFTVMPIDKRPCVEPHDASGQMVIVHSIES